MNAAKMVLGYFASVVTASAATASILTTAEATSVGTFVFLMIFGSAYIATCGLPGFAATVFLSRKYALRNPFFFAFAGGLNAIVAWTALYLVTGSGIRMEEPLFAASIVAGMAGGLAFWSIAARMPVRLELAVKGSSPL